jgi:hypothetical protein
MTDVLLLILAVEMGALAIFTGFLVSVVIYILLVEAKKPQITLASLAGVQAMQGHGPGCDGKCEDEKKDKPAAGSGQYM